MGLTSPGEHGAEPLPPDDAAAARKAKHRKREFAWVIVVVAFTLARLLVAWATKSTTHVNIWWFGVIDLGTAVPYALGTARLVTRTVEHRYQAATQWAMVAAVSFLAPYVYVAIGSGKPVPAIVWIVLGMLVLLFGGNAIASVRKKIRLARELVSVED